MKYIGKTFIYMGIIYTVESKCNKYYTVSWEYKKSKHFAKINIDEFVSTIESGIWELTKPLIMWI